MTIPTSLASPALLLRRLHLEDAPALSAAYLAAGRPDDVEPCATAPAARVAIAMYEQEALRGTRLVYGLYAPDGGPLLGCGSIMAGDPGVAQLGLWLAAPARGRGHGRAAIAALCELALRWLGAQHVELYCRADHAAMVRVAEATGFTCVAEGAELVWRYAGTPANTLREVADPRPPLSAPACMWTCIAGHLHASRTVVREEETACDVAIEVPGEAGPLRQEVTVEQGSLGDRPWLMLRAVVGPESLLDGRDALRHNATLAAGALALEDGEHVLRHGVPPDAITPDGIDRLLDLIACEAARLRLRGRAPTGTHALAFYAD